MATKTELYAKAQELGIPGRSKMDVKQLASAIDEATGGSPEASSDDRVAEREDRRKARRKEAALAAANRAENEAAARAQVRTAAQQALDRAQEGK